MSKIIGIDLGTTNSVVAVMEGAEPKVIVNADGARTTPSVVAWTDKDEVLVGTVAKRQAAMNPSATIASVKRFMGRRFEEVEEEAKRVPYKVVSGKGDAATLDVRGRLIAPPEVSAIVLRKLKEAAEAYLGEPVTAAVITVPAYFNDAQRQATKDAGKIAGLDVRRIVNEPTAAALAYGLGKEGDRTIAIYDFGGGTFDVSILNVSASEDGDVIEVVATNGDTHLGGDDVDAAIVAWLTREFKVETGVDLTTDKSAMQRLFTAAEKAKCELSSASETRLSEPFISMNASGPLHLQKTLTRARFEAMIAPLVDRSIACVRSALEDADCKPGDIAEVVLVGGSTRIPAVQAAVKALFGREPHRGVNPDEVVAIGAAVQGAVLSGDVKDLVLLDVTPLSLGVETLGGVMTVLVPRNTTVPTTKKEVFSTGTANQSSVEIHVLQGERAEASDNRTLGKFHLEGIMPAPRGVPKIEVAFDIDANGILSVHAKDLATGKDQQITISGAGGLSKDEIARMQRDAEEHVEDDKQRRAAAERRNELDALCCTVERLDMSEAARAKVEPLVANARRAMDQRDDAAVKAAMTALEAEVHRLASEAYSGATTTVSTTPPGPPTEPGRPPPMDVIDAEFEPGGAEA